MSFLVDTDQPIVQKYGGTSVGSPDKIKRIAARIKKIVEKNGSRIAVVVSAMSGETDRLVRLIKEINPALADRNYDMAVAAGEQVSVALMAAALDTYGLKSKGFLAYQLGILTYSAHSRARIASIDCRALHRCWENGVIPVIAGFQGTTDSLDITTLGRGGSDTSAVALAVALKAQCCEINTDVCGVFSADPRIVKNAILQPQIDFEVALEMASLGSKVLHSRCVELAAKHRLPILVRSTFGSTHENGTLIMDVNDRDKLEATMVTGVTLHRNIIKVSLQGLPTGGASIANVFERVAAAGINVDIIVHDQSHEEGKLNLGFTFDESELRLMEEEVCRWQKQPDFADFKVYWERGLAKVSVVGLGMQSNPGVAGKTFSALAAAGIEVKMISTSEIKISCVIDGKIDQQAVQVLHEAFME